jgi:hypothetical protein
MKPRPEPDSGQRGGRRHEDTSRSTSDQHHLAVVQAEARRLAQSLGPFGVLSKDQLKVAARATRWHEGSFESALRVAVESGEIERLPLDFYRKVPPQESGQPTPPSAA